MKGNKTRVITLLILIAFALIVGCSHETPTPSNQNNTTQNSNPQNNKPSTEENKDTTPPATETDKEETVKGPDWLKGKAFQGVVILTFDDNGIISNELNGYKFSHISNITEDSVTYVIVSDDGSETGDIIITKNPDPLLIDVNVNGNEFQLQLGEETI